MQEIFKFIRTDDENRHVRRSISGDTNKNSREDVEGEEADAQNSSTLVRSILVDCDCTNLNSSKHLDMKNILNLSNFFGINL